MYLNKRKQTEDDELNSNSNDYDLKSDTLDQLYKEQITELGDLILKKAQPNDMEICRKWFKIFNRVSSGEKMARNCLCTLMKEQIIENGYIQYPFNNLKNTNRNLECILRELDGQITEHSETDDTFKSHDFIIGSNFQQQEYLETILHENQNVELQTETMELKSQLQALRMQLTEKQIENEKLKEIAEKFRIEREMYEKILHNMKKSILENIREILIDMEQLGMIKKQLKFFQHIFVEFSNDKEFTNTVCKYDLDLQHVFHKQFKCEFDKRKSIIARHICRKFVKNKTKLREKFEHRLNVQNESHKLQLKLAKLNSFSILRQIFINYHNEIGEFEGWEILKALEDKYQNIVNDIK